nr:hypothetical protein [Tanacetum cinerariifolium]
DDPHRALKDKVIIDSGCSRHMTGNKAHLNDYQEFKGGSVAFGGSNGRIISEGKIKASSFNLKKIDPSGDLACLFAKASIDESNKLHRRKESNIRPLVRPRQVLVTKPQNKTPYDLLTGDKLEKNSDFKTCEKPVSQVEKIFLEELEKLKIQEKEATDAAESLKKEATYDIQNANTSSTYLLNIVSTPLSTGGPSRAFNDGEISYPDDPLMPHLEDIYTSPSKGILLIHLMMMKVW